MILQNNVSLRVRNFVNERISINQSKINIHLLLLSKTCSLSRRKMYDFVDNFMSMIISRLIICERKMMSIKVVFSNICTFFTLFLQRQNKDRFVNFFLKNISNCFCFKAIRKRNKCFDDIKKKRKLDSRKVKRA